MKAKNSNNFYSIDELKELGITIPENPTNIFISKKASLYNTERISIGNHVRIDDFAVLTGDIRIGNFVHIAPGAILAAWRVGIVLEDFCGISYHVKLLAASDDYNGECLTNSTIPERFKSIKASQLILQKHCIVGAGSVILPSSKGLSEGVSVGALSLVSRPTKPFGIYFGNPAKRILERSKNILTLEKEFLEFLKNENLTMGGGGKSPFYICLKYPFTKSHITHAFYYPTHKPLCA
ncbi:acyltransferase [Helicobacter bilis]|uniref:acyltransferase n=2 Tax=Helicobacter bilis TaxID=37372 RepID=UPI0025A9FDFF|nr:transferase [Helicobacter bilis]